MPTEVNNEITAKEFQSLSSSFILDLVAVFSLLEEDVQKTVNKANRSEWTPEQLFNEIDNLVGE